MWAARYAQVQIRAGKAAAMPGHEPTESATVAGTVRFAQSLGALGANTWTIWTRLLGRGSASPRSAADAQPGDARRDDDAQPGAARPPVAAKAKPNA